ncbi:hypothetical protein E2C01_090997 [Portunus trituberculatus]|uniref:Uncharacterized protein n=1 Tax=Portunus trituberculatus TaxID=210409 RepID=A0A5B7JCU6_PORTR|nr:hypothetical protein [Portunus trituberculatus]
MLESDEKFPCTRTRLCLRRTLICSKAWDKHSPRLLSAPPHILVSTHLTTITTITTCRPSLYLTFPTS